MDQAEYLKGIRELYAAEIEGEGMATRWLELTGDPDEQYKLGLFLQLESEAKVRLRPLMARHGLSLVEDPGSRDQGMKEAERFAGQPWKEAMAGLSQLCLPFAKRFRALLPHAPREDVPLIRFMIDHEETFSRIAAREAAGEPAMETELVTMLAHPFARPGAPSAG